MDDEKKFAEPLTNLVMPIFTFSRLVVSASRLSGKNSRDAIVLLKCSPFGSEVHSDFLTLEVGGSDNKHALRMRNQVLLSARSGLTIHPSAHATALRGVIDDCGSQYSRTVGDGCCRAGHLPDWMWMNDNLEMHPLKS